MMDYRERFDHYDGEEEEVPFLPRCWDCANADKPPRGYYTDSTVCYCLLDKEFVKADEGGDCEDFC